MTPQDKKREGHLRRKYGITIEDYEALLLLQHESCAICRKHYTEFKTKLAVDHDHLSRRIRGLLCNYCNRRLVGRHRDPEILRRIADYVEQGTNWYVPQKKRTIKRKPI